MSSIPRKRNDAVPTTFRISIGGFGGPNYEVRFVNGRLRYQANFSPTPVMISPTAEEWTQFWDRVEQCDLWHWAPRYDDPDILDGTQWELDIQLGRRRVTSFGSNAYPGGEGVGRSEPFQLFLRAVRKLIGGRRFGLAP